VIESYDVGPIPPLPSRRSSTRLPRSLPGIPMGPRTGATWYSPGSSHLGTASGTAGESSPSPSKRATRGSSSCGGSGSGPR
jgi:hypothetical protein